MTSWIEFLIARGALFDAEGVASSADADAVVSFGDAGAELVAARDHAVVSDLATVAVLRVAGADAAAFLQGQLTNDVLQLAPGASHYAAWCSAKGRMLANMVVRRVDERGFELMVPASLAAVVQKRLKMFVLRSKLTIEDVSATSVRLGIGGPSAGTVVQDAFGALPAPHRQVLAADASVMAIPGGRFVAQSSPEAAPSMWARLTDMARPAGLPAWQWLTIRAGVPVITAATTDQFVPQAANLDALDGVNFQKGCYTGQEIVARTQYLGRLKERLVLAHVDGSPPLPGSRLYSPAFEAQACGSVVNAAPAPGGGADLLAVLQLAARDSGEVHVDAPDGRRLALLPLPYALPDAPPRRGRIA
jgi:tRNA-modifying protein YgfZ